MHRLSGFLAGAFKITFLGLKATALAMAEPSGGIYSVMMLIWPAERLHLSTNKSCYATGSVSLIRSLN
jgi:hypothetical protein